LKWAGQRKGIFGVEDELVFKCGKFKMEADARIK